MLTLCNAIQGKCFPFLIFVFLDIPFIATAGTLSDDYLEGGEEIKLSQSKRDNAYKRFIFTSNQVALVRVPILG